MAARTLKKVRGLEVFTASGKQVGVVGDVLFGDGANVVGLSVQRPPLLLVISRKDRYLALDRARFGGNRVEASDAAGSWDADAATRLGISWDTTVIWRGMPVRTESGTAMGLVRDATFDPGSGVLESIGLTGGVTSDLAVGTRDLPGAFALRFEGDAVVLSDEASAVETTGGAAAVAGKAVAVAKVEGTKAVSAAAKAAGKAAGVAAASAGQAARAVAAQRPAHKAGRLLRTLKNKASDAMGLDED